MVVINEPKDKVDTKVQAGVLCYVESHSACNGTSWTTLVERSLRMTDERAANVARLTGGQVEAFPDQRTTLTPELAAATIARLRKSGASKDEIEMIIARLEKTMS